MKTLWIKLPSWIQGLVYALLIIFCLSQSAAPDIGFRYLDL